MAVLRRDRHLEDAADDHAILQHIVIVLVPADRRAFQDQRCHLRSSPTVTRAKSARSTHRTNWDGPVRHSAGVIAKATPAAAANRALSTSWSSSHATRLARDATANITTSSAVRGSAIGPGPIFLCLRSLHRRRIRALEIKPSCSSIGDLAFPAPS